MGSESKVDLQASDFIAQHRIAPVVSGSRVLDGLENAEEGFELQVLARGEHFGKTVIRMDGGSISAELLLRASTTSIYPLPISIFPDIPMH